MILLAFLVWQTNSADSNAAHEKVFTEHRFPSANTCQACHPDHYREWSVSPHAYAQLSPVFNAMQGTIFKLTNGTNGDFCIRCHTPVGMALEEPVFTANANRDPVSREGVTCISCHRMNKAYGKISGRMGLVEGPLDDPISGPTGNEELARVLADQDFRLSADENETGRTVHKEVQPFFEMSQSGFCGVCHDVNLQNGFRLEDAFSEYKRSPAAEQGISCQDCHMGIEPGKPSGYKTGPAAIVGDKPTRDRKITNHMFIGPDYSIVHPGLFPHNHRASRIADMKAWLDFNVEAGWGTDDFEDTYPEEDDFPDPWKSIDDRYDARDIIEDNLALLEEAHQARLKILQAGYVLQDVEVKKASKDKGIVLTAAISNGTIGHGVPTGFDAERLVFLRVTVRDPNGKAIYKSGDLDPNGDVRDSHSLYVHSGKLDQDPDLVSLQSKFITRLLRGGEREQVLAVNDSVTPLPFLRPPARSKILTGRPGGARKHKFNIPPGAKKSGTYKVAPEKLETAGTYKATVQVVAGMVPVNLVAAIKDVGFDYGLSPKEVARRIVKGHQVLWEEELDIVID